MVLGTSLFNTQPYKIHIKGNVEQSTGGSSALLLYFSVVAIEKGAFGSLSTTVANVTFTLFTIEYWIKFDSQSLKTFWLII